MKRPSFSVQGNDTGGFAATSIRHCCYALNLTDIAALHAATWVLVLHESQSKHRSTQCLAELFSLHMQSVIDFSLHDVSENILSSSAYWLLQQAI